MVNSSVWLFFFKSKLSDFSLLNVNIFWFLCSSIFICGQRKTSVDSIWAYCHFFTIFWHFTDQTTRVLIEEIITNWLTDIKNNSFGSVVISSWSQSAQSPVQTSFCAISGFGKPRSTPFCFCTFYRSKNYLISWLTDSHINQKCV